MNKIKTTSLIDKYLPADYIDHYSRNINSRQAITPGEFLDLAFNRLPKWIDRLLRLRNTIVKPLGLDTTSRFTDNIHAQNANEIIFGMPDKHLTFYVSLWCGAHKASKQELRITTVVKYNHCLGRLYFMLIRPFHSIIIRSILKNISSIVY